ncbi:MAG: hypothetical protein WAS33_30455, partial [Candidatus Promineifilaceae bacterium]
FFNEVLHSQRTGFYLRVLTPGAVQAGAELKVVERPSPQFTIQLINQNTLGTPEAKLVQQLLALPTLAEGWKQILAYKLKNRE